MRHPSEYFIKSLIVSGKTGDEIKELLKTYGLPNISEDYEDKFLDLLLEFNASIPEGYTGFRPKDRKFLSNNKIDGLIHPDNSVTFLPVILDHPYARRDIFLGALGRIDAEDLAEHVSHKYNLEVSYTHIAAITHYYFNVDIVSPDEWFNIFSEVSNESESQLHYACLMGGPVVASYKLGIERHVTVKEAVQEVVRSIYTTIHEIRDWPASAAKIKMLSDTMGALGRAHAVLNTSDQELAAVASELKTFKLARSVKKPIPLALLKKEKVV